MNTLRKKARRPWVLASLCCPFLVNCMMQSARADRVEMLNGAFVDGKIIEETPQGVKIEYNATATIKDIRTIPRAEITKITKEGPDQVEYRELSKLFPLPDFLTNDNYATLIEKKLKPFAAKFPGSKLISDVQRMIETADAERAKVTAGFLKVNAKWISPQEYEKDRYNYDALVLLSQMKRASATGDYNGALRIFDKIAGDYGVSAHFPAAVDEARKVVPGFDKMIRQMLKEAPVLNAQREKGLAGNPDPTDKKKVEDAIRAEKAGLGAKRDEEKKAGYRWLTYHKYDQASLEETSAQIKKLDLSLAQHNTESFARYSSLVRDAMKAIKERRLDDVAGLAKLATDAGAPKEMIEKLTKEAELLKAEAQKSIATPLPPPSTPPPVTAPVTVDPDMANILAEAGNPLGRSLAQQQEQTDAIKAAAAAKPEIKPEPSLLDKMKAGAATVPGAVSPPPGASPVPASPPTVTPPVPPAPGTEVTPPPAASVPATKPAPAPVPPAPASPAPPVSPAMVVEDEGGISPLMIGGAGAAVLLLGLLVWQKRRVKTKSAEDEEEEVEPEPEVENINKE